MTAVTALPETPIEEAPRRLEPALLVWFAVAAVAVLTIALRKELPWLVSYPAELVVPLDVWINAAMAWFTDIARGFFRTLSWLFAMPMNGLRAALQWIPWPAAMVIVTMVAHRAGGWRLALFTALAMAYIVVVGYWDESMNTLSLVALSVPLSLTVGLLVGVAAFKSRQVERVVQPTLDLMQTFPTFAYLIPILLLFGFGPVVGLIASSIYAMPPMVRNVMLGLSRVSDEVVESGTMSGATRRQLLWWVQVPSAMPTIMVGVNQTTMAALSMVIIAAIIGGSADIGWEVLSTMRKAQFGQSFLAGIVIALMAMVMDRITRGFTDRERFPHAGSGPFWRRHRGLVAALAILALFAVLAELFPALRSYPRDWVYYPAGPLNDMIDYLTANYPHVTDFIKNNTLFYFMLPIRIGLENTIKPFTWGFNMTPTVTWAYVAIVATLGLAAGRAWSWRASVGVAILAIIYYFGTAGTPWPLFIAMITVLAWQVGGRRVGLLSFLALVFMLTTGIWPETMRSLYLCGAAVLFSFIAGAAIGIWAALDDRASAFIRPINDTLQTMPLFVFLIPVIMFFQIGDFPALLAIIMYAIVPSIRYTEHGIRHVRADIVEAARMQGCTRGQILWQVQLPLALPEIALGLNQTIMFGLAMVVIAALVGTKGLGQAVYIALNAGNVGAGCIAGFSMAFIAMITDRIIQAWSAKKKAELGLE